VPYYVYILASHARTLYIGVTNDLERRAFEHKHSTDPKAFTARYKITRLVYFEESPEVVPAIEREKEIKAWRRAKKVALIESMNPYWNDLAADWY
jgi:putative endonuclease